MNELNNINKNNAFKVPEDYFENFSAELETLISEENLKKKFGNKNSFNVPENYFETFSITKTKSEKNIFRIIRPWLSAAAGIIIVFALWQFLLTGIDKNNHAQNNDSINKINSYIIANNQININDSDLQYLEPEVNEYIDGTDASQLYEYANDETKEDKISVDDETVYEYFVDYADDNDYTELLAGL